MAVQWATMIYEVTSAKTLVRYIVCHDLDAKLVFKITVVPIGAEARVSSMREELEDSVCMYLLYYLTGCLGHPHLGVIQYSGCIFLAFYF